MKRIFSLLALLCIYSNAFSQSYSNPLVIEDSADPTVLEYEGAYYQVSTERGGKVSIRYSTDLINWKHYSDIFTKENRPNFVEKGGIWAPDINYIDGRFYLFYSMSTWGGEWAAGIGVASADNLMGPWTDQGKLFISTEIEVQNSIDPCYFQDKGRHYLFWGSFRGIHAIELDIKDGKVALKEGSQKQQVAGTAYEGVMIHKHKGYYYMFASTGSCCSGLKSTYTTVVGRSKKLMGPYVDKEGKPMLENNHEILISNGNGFKGTGHNSEIIKDKKGQDWIFYHAYWERTPSKGRLLLADKLVWEKGWPRVENGIPHFDNEVFCKEYPERTSLLSSTDMVLLYGGSPHRKAEYRWTPETIKDYVEYTDREGKSHWLFDSFLLLEFMNAGGEKDSKTLITGYKYKGEYLHSAVKQNWKDLIDYYFADGSGVDALELAIEETAKTIGDPKTKRQVVIGIPEPIRHEFWRDETTTTKYWGELDGVEMDFSKQEDRIKVCKWYIDQVKERFAQKNYKHVELSGFYWVAEESSHTSTLIKEIACYLNASNYSLSWIPYFKAHGYKDWKKLGFNYAYHQPNHFFNESIPYERIPEACKLAQEAGMDMEMEFDEYALKWKGWGYRLRAYIQGFKESGAWEKSRLAYYQGSWAIHNLRQSKEKEDNELYHELCEFIISRPIRNK